MWKLWIAFNMTWILPIFLWCSKCYFCSITIWISLVTQDGTDRLPTSRQKRQLIFLFSYSMFVVMVFGLLLHFTKKMKLFLIILLNTIKTFVLHTFLQFMTGIYCVYILVSPCYRALSRICSLRSTDRRHWSWKKMHKFFYTQRRNELRLNVSVGQVLKLFELATINQDFQAQFV